MREFAKLQRLKVIVSLWLIGAAVCDVVITFALTWHLVSSALTVDHAKGLICGRGNTALASLAQTQLSTG